MIDPATEAVEAEARLVADGSSIGCAIADSSGEIIEESRASGDGAAVRCQAVLP